MGEIPGKWITTREEARRGEFTKAPLEWTGGDRWRMETQVHEDGAWFDVILSLVVKDGLYVEPRRVHTFRGIPIGDLPHG